LLKYGKNKAVSIDFPIIDHSTWKIRIDSEAYVDIGVCNKRRIQMNGNKYWLLKGKDGRKYSNDNKGIEYWRQSKKNDVITIKVRVINKKLKSLTSAITLIWV